MGKCHGYKRRLEKRMRKAIEAALISTSEVSNHRERIIKWAGRAACLAVRSIKRIMSPD